jgi:pimeloyl-ACP methyl ester carboxylesterase
MDRVNFHSVTSLDGTPIAYSLSGTGPPLILVHGAGAANALAWTAVIPVLEKHFTVCVVDRRGHGNSGDQPAYTLEREFEDIASVVDAMGEPAHLLAHSFGGLCALEAALLTSNVRKLILYEPLSISSPGKSLYPPGFIDKLQSLIDMGDREGALIWFYDEFVGLTPTEVSVS